VDAPVISTVVMFQEQNRETINSTWKAERLLYPSRSLWRRAWQDRVSQYNGRGASYLRSWRLFPKV